MPDQADNSHRPTRRSRHPPKTSAGSSFSDVVSSQEPEPSADTVSKKQALQPTKILRRGDPDVSLDAIPIADLETTAPVTPRRPNSMCFGNANQETHSNGLPSEQSQTKKTRTRTRKNQGHRQSYSASPTQAPNGTPVSVPRRDPVTPSRAKETPVKAYAGPTFHASPAASSLPMPKFYSKSVPNVEKTKSLKTMMEQEPIQSSSGGETSPSLENVHPPSDQSAFEESPLDIFFKADRKAKGLNDSTQLMQSDSNLHANSLHSPSRLPPSSRKLSRPTSAAEIFALEMDGTPPESPIHRKVSFSNGSKDVKSANQASTKMTETEQDEQRKAQAIALKKLLHSPRPQIPSNSAAGQRSQSSKQSSKLRKEILTAASPGYNNTPELPATPTPSGMNSNCAASVDSIRREDYAPPYHRTPHFAPLPDQGYNQNFTHETTNPTSIENDLRRILKLEIR